MPSSAKAQKDGHIRVHSFDVVSQSWSELETGGAVPRSRGGHTATLVRMSEWACSWHGAYG